MLGKNYKTAVNNLKSFVIGEYFRIWFNEAFKSNYECIHLIRNFFFFTMGRDKMVSGFERGRFLAYNNNIEMSLQRISDEIKHWKISIIDFLQNPTIYLLLKNQQEGRKLFQNDPKIWLIAWSQTNEWQQRKL